MKNTNKASGDFYCSGNAYDYFYSLAYICILRQDLLFYRCIF
jgi:hypothetical protein